MSIISFFEFTEKIKKDYKGVLVIINLGVFFVATNKDAIFLEKAINLKKTCLCKNVCKVGIPESKIEEYILRLKKLNIKFVVLAYSNNLEEKYKFKDKKYIQKYIYNEGEEFFSLNYNINCNECKHVTNTNLNCVKINLNNNVSDTIVKIIQKNNDIINDINIVNGDLIKILGQIHT